MDYMLIAAAVLLLSSTHTLTFPVYPAQCANTSAKEDKQNGVQMVAILPPCCAWVGEDRSWLVKIHLVPTCMAILSCIIWSRTMRDCADAARQSMVTRRRPHDAPPGDLVTLLAADAPSWQPGNVPRKLFVPRSLTRATCSCAHQQPVQGAQGWWCPLLQWPAVVVVNKQRVSLQLSDTDDTLPT
jgi:hypothetical protein